MVFSDSQKRQVSRITITDGSVTFKEGETTFVRSISLERSAASAPGADLTVDALSVSVGDELPPLPTTAAALSTSVEDGASTSASSNAQTTSESISLGERTSRRRIMVMQRPMETEPSDEEAFSPIVLLGAVIGAVLALVLGVGACLLFRGRKKPDAPNSVRAGEDGMNSVRMESLRRDSEPDSERTIYTLGEDVPMPSERSDAHTQYDSKEMSVDSAPQRDEDDNDDDSNIDVGLGSSTSSLPSINRALRKKVYIFLFSSFFIFSFSFLFLFIVY